MTMRRFLLASLSVAVVGLLVAAVGMDHGHGRKFTSEESVQLLARFDTFDVPHDGTKPYKVYVTKTGVKPVLVMHEITGLTPETLELALRLEEANFRVYMPVLFGKPGHRLNRFRIAAMALHPASNPFARDEVSPRIKIAEATLGAITSRSGNRPIGVVGMCLTGNFGIALLSDPRVGRAVLSQPAVPFGLTSSHKQALGVSDDDIARARQSGKPMMALRFNSDAKSPVDRWQRLEKEFSKGGQIRLYPPIVTGVEPWRIPRNAHAVLTQWYLPEMPEDFPTHVAFREVVRFLDEQK